MKDFIVVPNKITQLLCKSRYIKILSDRLDVALVHVPMEGLKLRYISATSSSPLPLTPIGITEEECNEFVEDILQFVEEIGPSFTSDLHNLLLIKE